MCKEILLLTFSGIPISEAYPHFGDPFELNWWCEVELAAWREALAAHKRIASIEGRMHARPKLEAAFNALKAAYVEAVNQDQRAAA